MLNLEMPLVVVYNKCLLVVFVLKSVSLLQAPKASDVNTRVKTLIYKQLRTIYFTYFSSRGTKVATFVPIEAKCKIWFEILFL